jgi:hypothetical protein
VAILEVADRQLSLAIVLYISYSEAQEAPSFQGTIEAAYDG